ncbi:hypothetical protein BH20ACT2_BH20ACT2_15220 [soil metagenome]
MPKSRQAAAALVAGLLLVGGVSACSDEDGDGATTDEEIQDLEDTGEDVGNELEEEIDGQDEGDNEG